MTDYKEHSAIFLSNRLRGSSDWRRAQGTQFPADTRNDKASQRWLELELLIQISDTVWTAIAAYYNESDSRWLAAVSDTNRDIGFRWHPRHFAAQGSYNRLSHCYRACSGVFAIRTEAQMSR